LAAIEQYEATFRENAISEKILPNLTAEDFKDLGVGMVGHRRMLLEAIAALRVDADAKAAPADVVRQKTGPLTLLPPPWFDHLEPQS
jgi:hypothetical protein